MPASTNNEIILIGGREIRSENEEIAKYLSVKAGGEIGVVTLARDQLDGKDFIARMSKLYAKFDCKIRHVESANDLQDLGLVYYAGGKHNLLAKRLKETGLHLELLNQWRAGEVVIAGSSAGAMVLCGVMLDEDNDDLENGSVDLTYGLGPLGACFVVPHWSQWTKPAWRRRLLQKHGEGYYIFGIDENTAMVWRAGHCQVVGSGKVYARGRMQGEWGNGETFEIARGW